MTEVVPGTVDIYLLRKFFYGTPSTEVTYSNQARSGSVGRSTTTVSMRGLVCKYDDVMKLYHRDLYMADIDGAPFELWLQSASVQDSKGYDVETALDPEVTLIFEGRRVQPTIHPVEAWRRRYRL